MAQVVDGEHGARGAVDAAWPVLGREVDGHHGGVPVVGNEDAVVAVRAAFDVQLQRRLQPRQAQQRVPELPEVAVHPFSDQSLALHKDVPGDVRCTGYR